MAGNTSDGELDLADYLKILKRRWRWFALGLVTVMSLAVTLSLTQPDRFRASSAVLLRTSAAQDALDQGILSTSFLSRELGNEINFAESDVVRDAVEADIGIIPSVSISNESGTDLLVFTATASFPQNAARDANAWATAYIDAKREIASTSILGAVEEFEAELADLRAQRASVRAPLDDLERELAGATVVSRPDLEKQIDALELQVADELAVIDAQIAGTFDRSDLSLLRSERRRLLAPITALQQDLPIASEVSRAQLQVQVDILTNQLAGELDLIDARINTTARNITDLELSSQLAAEGTGRVVQVAAVPSAPINAPIERNIALGLVVGSILGLAAALLAETLDQSINSADDIRSLTDVPVLGTVPESSKDEAKEELALATLLSPTSGIADAYHKVRSSLQYALVDNAASSILVTSANESEGKTTSAVNIAWALAGVGNRVALADADFRRPRVHAVFGLPSSPGQSDHLLGSTPLVDLVRHINHPEHSMVVLPTGTLPPNPADFVASRSFTALLADLARESDVLVLDAPPVLPVSDAVTTARSVDATILTVRARSTTKEQLEQAIDALRQGGAHLVGIVLVGGRAKETTYYGESSGAVRPSVITRDRGTLIVPTPGALPTATAPRPSAPSPAPEAANAASAPDGQTISLQTVDTAVSVPAAPSVVPNGASSNGARRNGKGPRSA